MKEKDDGLVKVSNGWVCRRCGRWNTTNIFCDCGATNT